MVARSGSFSYPTNHLLGVVDDPARAASAARSLTEAGFESSRITLLRGDEGAARIDGLGGRRSSRFSTEEFSRWRGPELPMPEFLRR